MATNERPPPVLTREYIYIYIHIYIFSSFFSFFPPSRQKMIFTKTEWSFRTSLDEQPRRCTATYLAMHRHKYVQTIVPRDRTFPFADVQPACTRNTHQRSGQASIRIISKGLSNICINATAYTDTYHRAKPCLRFHFDALPIYINTFR